MTVRLSARVIATVFIVILGAFGVTTGTASAGIFDPQTCATAFDDSYEPGYDNLNPRRGEITNPWDQQYLLADEEGC